MPKVIIGAIAWPTDPPKAPRTAAYGRGCEWGVHRISWQRHLQCFAQWSDFSSQLRQRSLQVNTKQNGMVQFSASWYSYTFKYVLTLPFRMLPSDMSKQLQRHPRTSPQTSSQQVKQLRKSRSITFPTTSSTPAPADVSTSRAASAKRRKQLGTSACCSHKATIRKKTVKAQSSSTRVVWQTTVSKYNRRYVAARWTLEHCLELHIGGGLHG